MSSENGKSRDPSASRCYGDDVQVQEWWAVAKDGFVLKWSPHELWIQCGYRSLVIVDFPTYGDVRKAILGLGWQLPAHLSA